MGESGINRIIAIALSALITAMLLLLIKPAYSDPLLYFGMIFLAMIIAALILAFHDRGVSHRATAAKT